MNKCLYFLTTCFLLIIYTPFSLIAQHTGGTVRGKVVLADEKPAASVTVKVKGTGIAASTNEMGEFLLRDLSPGTHQLESSMIGYEAGTQIVNVENDKVTPVTIRLKEAINQLNEVVVTGQYEPQSLRKSVYQIRTISSERIQQRGATNVLGVLNNELGFRFSNDMTLGTTDVQLMGMTGRNVKILLDGVPMADRGDTRESLSQIDINQIERIEIVEGPMSVSYGSDALAGVINIITKKPGAEHIWVNARLQEETVNNTYHFFSKSGLHNQSVALGGQKKRWNASAGVTNNTFGGWQGLSQERSKDWLPKDQLFGNVKLGYRTDKTNLWYRLDALKETILSEGNVNKNTQQARDQKFITHRWMHQLQGDWKISERLQLNTQASYTDYKRRTQTSVIDLTTGKRTLSIGQGEQDVSTFQTQTFRAAAQYRLSSVFALQPGVDINLDAASGARISGSPAIHDFAFFVSATIAPTSKISLRPGVRFIKNSVYDAPPVIPSLNTKFTLNGNLDFRLSYARGFRSPALRELYFNFFDASHSIKGNPNLKAEYSDSFNGSLAWQYKRSGGLLFKSTLGFFYNDFRNLINYGFDPKEPNVSMTINIDKFKTTGSTFENTLYYRNLQTTLGFSYIGRYNLFSEDEAFKDDNIAVFLWSPEVNSNFTYDFKSIGTKLNFFYKYTGKRPSYSTTTNSSGQAVIRLTEVAPFHWADITVTKVLSKYISLTGGVKNIFNITRLNNTSADTGSAHSSGGAVPMGYGRSYFIGLNARRSK